MNDPAQRAESAKNLVFEVVIFCIKNLWDQYMFSLLYTTEV